MRRKREQESVPWLKLFLSLTAVGVLGLVGYQAVNEAVHADRPPALHEMGGQTFSDFPELADSLEENSLFVPRFLMDEMPQLFVDTLPEVCLVAGKADSFTDLLSATPEHSLSVRGYGDKVSEYVFSVYTNRSVCQDGQAEFRLSFTRGSTPTEREIFADDVSGRQAMLAFLEERFRTLSQNDLPELLHLQLLSITNVPVHQLAELRASYPEDPISLELERIVKSLYTPDFNSEGIANFRVLRTWSRSYSANITPPSAVRIEMSFTNSEIGFLEGTATLTRRGEGLLLSGTDTQYELPLDPHLYPALFAFLGGEDQ